MLNCLGLWSEIRVVILNILLLLVQLFNFVECASGDFKYTYTHSAESDSVPSLKQFFRKLESSSLCTRKNSCADLSGILPMLPQQYRKVLFQKGTRIREGWYV